MKIVCEIMTLDELNKMAEERFGTMVKAVVEIVNKLVKK
jgi:hypothetical protein